jgi:hypothetical protein
VLLSVLLTGDGELVDGMLAAVVKIVMSHCWQKGGAKLQQKIQQGRRVVSGEERDEGERALEL